MRLLHFAPSGKLFLTDFHGKTIPPYAVLSHRWEENEVLIEDLGKHDCQKMRGYRKIKFCAYQAALDGLTYFWIDTCCIDKHNSLERANSIRSMFDWYKAATKCYVFLSDVSESDGMDTRQKCSWEAAFRTSVWFMRGWTLQELIAPRDVEFFTYEGRRIGSKSSLEQLLHEITGIPLKALQNCPLETFSISERMRWAANRKTTEEEDIVYCLFGILGVSMLVNYNEGGTVASMRLQEHLSASTAPSTVPFLRNDKFVGRESQLASLGGMLFTDERTTMIAIHGPGGTGKSQLALKLVHKTREERKNCSAFWVDASDMNSLQQGYLNIAQRLSIAGWDDEKADVKKLVEQHLSTDGVGQWLLVFDGMDDIDLKWTGLSETRAGNSTNYLPQSQSGSVVFTTTSLEIAERLASLQNTVHLEELAPDIALVMLKQHLLNPIPPLQIPSAEVLLVNLSHLPLAIIQAAAYMNTAGTTIDEYRQMFSKQEDEILQQGSEPSRATLREDNAKSSVTTTLHISVNHIRHNTPLAAEYLFLAASLDRKDIPDEVFVAYSPNGRRQAMKVLSDYALVTRRTVNSSLDLHRLVHNALQELLAAHDLQDEWTHNAMKALNSVFPYSNQSNRSKCRRLLPHAGIILSRNYTKEMDKDRMYLMYKSSAALGQEGRHDERAELGVKEVKMSKKVLGEEHPDTLISMNNLASTYREQGRWKEAEELGQQVLEIRKRVLGEEHPHTMISMGNLASTYREQGRWKEAEELGQQVLEIRKRVLGEEHPHTMISMGNLASAYTNQGRWKEAGELGQQVLEIQKRVLGEEHPDTLNSMNNLASTYTNQGRWKEAEELGQQVLEIQKRVLGEEHPETLTSMGNLASAYTNQGRWKEAEELGQQVLEIQKRVLGEEHPDTLNSMNNLASAYTNQGRWKEAEELGQQVLEIRKRVLGEEHPDTLISMNNLALTYTNQGRWKEAEELGQRVLEIRKRVLREEHPDTLISMNNLASTYTNQGRWKEAEELGQQVLEIQKRVLGEEHPETLISMGNLASAYTNQGRWKEAEGLGQRVLEIQKRVLGEEHPHTLASMNNLACNLNSQGRVADSISLMETVLEKRQKVLGLQHPHTQDSATSLDIFREQSAQHASV
jgi:tetratricopeptide (TPR) repeat protein/Cdc6-like AAA superfamily ATPase